MKYVTSRGYKTLKLTNVYVVELPMCKYNRSDVIMIHEPKFYIQRLLGKTLRKSLRFLLRFYLIIGIP